MKKATPVTVSLDVEKPKMYFVGLMRKEDNGQAVS